MGAEPADRATVAAARQHSSQEASAAAARQHSQDGSIQPQESSQAAMVDEASSSHGRSSIQPWGELRAQ